MKKPITLLVLDGWGYRTETKDNAVAAAKTPYFDYLWNKYPHTLLEACGEAVGLPDGQVGNSEIGHTTIGAGAALDTDLVRIKKAIQNGEFHKNEAFLKVFEHVQTNNSRLHVMGLLSDGGVHSHQDHLFELLRAGSLVGIKDIAVHVFTDGRDTSTTGSQQYLRDLENLLSDLDCGFIATLSGRYWAMDRDSNWDRLDKTMKAMFHCEGGVCEINPSEYVKQVHAEGISDEHIEPVIIKQVDKDPVKVEKNDGIIFINFRSDRARMISEKLLDKKEEYNLSFATMTEYKQGFDTHVAFPVKIVETTLAEQVSLAGLSQAHIAETEKFPHATYFLNAGKDDPHEGEVHIGFDSRKDIPTHDHAPEMRALDIAEKVKEVLDNKLYDFLFINIANPDVVGHTANVPAIITALETTDKALEIIVKATLDAGGIAIVTADHGNAETNREEDGSLHTSHTYNLVPCIITEEGIDLIEQGTLADLAPTVLEYLDIKKPESMTGESLKK